MDPRRFDAMTIRLARLTHPRRVAFRLAAGAALAGVLGRAGRGAGAAAATCSKVGRPCKRATQCCSGLCAGKRGGKTCRGHGAGTCQRGQNVCTAANPRTLLCNNDVNCACFGTTAGTSFCANVLSFACAGCARDADCLALGFPAGSACITTAVGACIGACDSGAACFAPCGADGPPLWRATVRTAGLRRRARSEADGRRPPPNIGSTVRQGAEEEQTRTRVVMMVWSLDSLVDGSAAVDAPVRYEHRRRDRQRREEIGMDERRRDESTHRPAVPSQNGTDRLADRPVSRRAEAIGAVAPFRLSYEFRFDSAFARLRQAPGTLDFTYGDPHEMAPEPYVAALRASLEPQDEGWFAYKESLPEAQEAEAASLRRRLGVPFEPDDVAMTTGGFVALALALKVVADPGDEAIFSLPPWFFTEALVVEAGLTPVKVRIDAATFDLDLDAIAAAITPRTRVVIVNSPNNPTGRIYPPRTLERLAALLEEASARNGRRISLISDEAYNRIVFDGARFRSPVEFYRHAFLAYSYGKTLLAPGERIGYLAMPPAMPEREALRRAIQTLQIAIGWAFPNAVLQYAVPRLEEITIDVGGLQRKRDRMAGALREMGYDLHLPEGTFYLFPRSPIADDAAFAGLLAEQGILVMPGRVFETPGFFRICLTATEETIERSLPGFAAALQRATTAAGAA